MSPGKALAIAAVVGVGIWLVSRSSSAAPAPSTGPAPLPKGTQLKASFVPFVPPLPGLAPAYAVVSPIANHITTPLINGLNNGFRDATGGSIGPVEIGGSPYGPLTSNGDGTFTNGFGDKVTPQPNGTINISSGKGASWYERNVGGPVSGAGTAVVHFISGLL